MPLLPVSLGRGRSLPPEALPAIMGILNVTPDSFSDGGALRTVDLAVQAGRRMAEEGALILDVGGESTRPGASEVTVDEELRRVVPVVRALVERVGLPVSVDTRKAAVFREAWASGASILNDVSGLAQDPEMAAAAAAAEAAVVVMHLRGTPGTMDSLAAYEDPVTDVISELGARLAAAERAGIPRARLLADPGLGFAKTAEQSWEIVRRIQEFRALGLPLVVGPSRKRFLAAATGREDPRDRDPATAVVAAHLARAGVEILRVHAVRPCADALRIARALDRRGGPALGGR